MSCSMPSNLAFDSSCPHDGILSSQSLCRILPKFYNSHLPRDDTFLTLKDARPTQPPLCMSAIPKLLRFVGISIDGVYHLNGLESYTREAESQRNKELNLIKVLNLTPDFLKHILHESSTCLHHTLQRNCKRLRYPVTGRHNLHHGAGAANPELIGYDRATMKTPRFMMRICEMRRLCCVRLDEQSAGEQYLWRKSRTIPLIHPRSQRSFAVR